MSGEKMCNARVRTRQKAGKLIFVMTEFVDLVHKNEISTEYRGIQVLPISQ